MSPNSAADLPEGYAELKSTTAVALRTAMTSDRRAWYGIERLVREYVRTLRDHGLKSDRAVAEAKALVVEATGDPLSSLLTSAVTWALSEYYER